MDGGTVVLFSWGANSYGQLCCGHKEDTIAPERVQNCPVTTDVKQLIGGGGHSAILTKNGGLHMCGWNNKGQLGLGHNDDVSIPQQVPHLPEVCSIACGWNHTLALSETGDVYVWGANAFGQLGTGKDTGFINQPVHLNVFGKATKSIAAGLRHSLAVTVDGEIWSWGSNKRGQLGLEDTKSIQSKPMKVPLKGADIKLSRISAGSHHSVALSDSGVVFVWGCNQHGQCGKPCDKLFITQLQPIRGDLQNVKVVDVQSGWTHIVATSDERKVFTWGRSDYGQLGQGDDVIRLKKNPNPTEIPLPNSVKQVCCGSEHCIAVTTDGQVLSWGWNEHGICGSEDEVNVHTPRLVPKLQGNQISLVGCSYGSSYAVSCLDNNT